MNKLKVKVNDRFQFFSVVLNVRGGEEIDWPSLTESETVSKMMELKFRTPLELASLMKKFEGVSMNSNVDKSRVRKFKFKSFKGQLERGAENGRPHYNLAVKTSSRVLTSVIIRELSLALYSEKNCKSISVEPAHDIVALEEYCLKLETRFVLPGTAYYPPSLDTRVSEFLEALTEDEELKKVHEHPRLYQQIIFAMIQGTPDRRGVNFLFNPVGGIGKSLTADYIALNPEFEGLLAPQLTSPERWVSAFISQMKSYISVSGKAPKTIIIDMTRNEDNANVEVLYSTLENIKNGRVDSTFYGKFQRLRFQPPHVLVFTNSVPNMSALSSDRFNLFFLADKAYSFTMVKCTVSLRLCTISKSLVTWNYQARVFHEEVQEDFYEKVLSADMVKEAMSALTNKDGPITRKPFEGDKRTKSHMYAPEPVQELLNKILESKF
jgi:hypothetical protein